MSCFCVVALSFSFSVKLRTILSNFRTKNKQKFASFNFT